MQIGSKTIEITIANAVAIVTTVPARYILQTISGLTSDELRQYKEWKISIYHTHNAAAEVRINTVNNAAGISSAASSGLIYLEANALASGSNDIILNATAGGTGVNAKYKTVPALKGIHSNLIIDITYPVAPTSGSLTIKIEGVR